MMYEIHNLATAEPQTGHLLRRPNSLVPSRANGPIIFIEPVSPGDSLRVWLMQFSQKRGMVVSRPQKKDGFEGEGEDVRRSLAVCSFSGLPKYLRRRFMSTLTTDP
jgi:hypothetical protein